jgi:phosphatidylglycerophosphate synthase
MDTLPKRSKVAGPYRYALNVMEPYLVFPFKNPDVYSIASLLLSVLFLVFSNRFILIALLTVTLILDWMDGAAARRFKKTRKEGYLIDVMFDRISEAFLFAPIIGTPLGKWFAMFYLMNIAFSFYAIISSKHYVLALRFIYLLLLVFNLQMR